MKRSLHGWLTTEPDNLVWCTVCRPVPGAMRSVLSKMKAKTKNYEEKPLIILFYPFFLWHLEMYISVKGSASIPATIENPL